MARNTAGLKRGGTVPQPRGGTHTRPTVYLMPEEQARLEAHLQHLTTQQRSRELARLLMVGLHHS